MTTSPVDKLFEDNRPIAEMPFGAEAKPEEREETAARVRAMLEKCGVVVADDINQLGCTGVVAALKEPGIETLPILAARFLRMGLAGGGVGLPCFVPIDRYCLVHETIGGLEPGQVQHHPEYVDTVSRALTNSEKGKVAVIDLARKRGRKSTDVAADILGGRDESLLEEPEEEVARHGVVLEDADTARTWKCREHMATNWACRHCAAQAVVEGPLEPLYTVDSHGAGTPNVPLTPAQLTEELARLERDGSDLVRVSVRVALFTRKLSRA